MLYKKKQRTKEPFPPYFVNNHTYAICESSNLSFCSAHSFCFQYSLEFTLVLVHFDWSSLNCFQTFVSKSLMIEKNLKQEGVFYCILSHSDDVCVSRGFRSGARSARWLELHLPVSSTRARAHSTCQTRQVLLWPQAQSTQRWGNQPTLHLVCPSGAIKPLWQGNFGDHWLLN